MPHRSRVIRLHHYHLGSRTACFPARIPRPGLFCYRVTVSGREVFVRTEPTVHTYTGDAWFTHAAALLLPPAMRCRPLVSRRTSGRRRGSRRRTHLLIRESTRGSSAPSSSAARGDNGWWCLCSGLWPVRGGHTTTTLGTKRRPALRIEVGEGARHTFVAVCCGTQSRAVRGARRGSSLRLQVFHDPQTRERALTNWQVTRG